MQDERYILLVEDDFVDERRFRRALLDLGISVPVVVAHNPEEARNLLTDTKPLPFLIMLDLYTPLDDGVDFIQCLKEAPSLRAIPVVVLTGSEVRSDIRRCYHRGIAGYILKAQEYHEYVQNIKTIIHYWQISESPKTCMPVGASK